MSPHVSLFFEVFFGCLDVEQTPDNDLTWARTGSEFFIRLLTVRQIVHFYISNRITTVKQKKAAEVQFLTSRGWKRHH